MSRQSLCHVLCGVLLTAAIAFLSVYYFRNIHAIPFYDGDETGVSSLPYRFAEFGDWRYPILLSQAFGNDELRTYPPIMGLAWRAAFASLPGIDPLEGRIFSAVAVLASVTLCGLLVWLATGRRWWAFGLGTLLVGVHPSVLQAARSVRFEQEIVLAGLAALTCLVLAWKRERALGLIGLAGLFAAFASASHPYGMVYGVVLGSALLVRCWHRRSRWRRALGDLAAFFVGAAVPVAVTLWWLLEKGDSLLAFQRAVRPAYALQTGRIQTALLDSQPYWLVALLPDRIASGLEEIRRYGFYLRDAPFEAWWAPFQWSAWPLFLIAAGGLVLLLARGVRVPPAVWLSVLVAVGLTAFTLGYPPNTNYYQYVAVHVSLAAVLVMVLSTVAAKLPYQVIGFALLTGWSAFLVGFTSNMFPQVLAAAEMERIGFAERAKRFAALAEIVGVGVESRRYCGFVTWPACGDQHQSLMEISPLGLAEPPEHVDAVMMDAFLQNGLAGGYPSFTDPQLTPAERLERLAALTAAAPLAGVYLQTDATALPDMADLIYSNEAQRPGRIVTALSRGFAPMDLLIDSGAVAPSTTTPSELAWNGLREGWHLLVVPPDLTTSEILISSDTLVDVLPAANLRRLEAVHTVAAIHVAEAATLEVSSEPSNALNAARLLRLEPFAGAPVP